MQLKQEIKKEILVNKHQEVTQLIEGQTKIILAEAQGGWLQRNWRPLLMLICILIIFNNYVLFPYLSMFTEKATMLELPKGLWALINLGVGGYIAGRSAEKIMDKRTIVQASNNLPKV
jgi:predicted MFS family arabinose efflux permease